MAHEPGSVRRRVGPSNPSGARRRDGADPRVVERSRGDRPRARLDAVGHARAPGGARRRPPRPRRRFEDRGGLCPGAGHGLLHLGAAEVDTPLPPGFAFWRDLGRAFVTQLCAMPELEASRKRLQVPLPEAEIQALAAGAPPMVGGEYLDTAALAACWEAMSAACRAELAEFDGPLEAFLRSRHAAWHVVGRVHFHLAENRADPDGAVRVPRDLQHASHQAGQGAAPSARRGDPRIRGRGQPRQAPGPARARADRGGAESPVARAGGFGRRVSAARPDA